MKLVTVTLILSFFYFSSFGTIGAITGSTAICNGSATYLSDTTTGGVWSSSLPGIATVGYLPGEIIGLSAGTTTITYTVGGSYVTTELTVNPLPPVILGYLDMCYGSVQLLTDDSTGGIWISSNSAIATIGSVSGVLTAVGSGDITITYTLPTGCSRRMSSHIYPPPTLLIGCNNIGVGDSLSFYGIYGGGLLAPSLYSDNYSIARENTWTGKVAGISPGATTIRLFGYGGCEAAYMNITVTAVTEIQPITGINTVCAGITAMQSDPTPLGIWSSSDPSTATINSSGVVNATSGGSTIISYSIPGGFTCTEPFYVNTLPAPISGAGNVCAGDTITLGSNTGGYRWGPTYSFYYYFGPIPIDGYLPPDGGWFTSGDTDKAKVVASILPGTGYIKGISAGIAIITYTDDYTYCTVTSTITINPSPSVLPAITGPAGLCTGTSIIFGDAAAGGVWSISDTTIASINAVTGNATGIIPGAATVTYTIANVCGTSIATMPLTVNPEPAAIAGIPGVCEGSSAILSDTGDGTWTSSDPFIASIGATGILTGFTPGFTTINYQLPTGCGTSVIATVNQLPSAITGPGNVCAGSAIVLSDSSAGGTWSCAGTTSATIGSGTGILSGITPGLATINYTVPTGCSTSAIVTVNPQPSAITGAAFVCTGATTFLSDSTAGGTWSSGTTTSATIDGGSGMLTGTSAGTSVITYMLSTGCKTTAAVTINPLPSPISGAGSVCLGDAITLSDAGGGMWSSSSSSATIGSATGIATGSSAGITEITYTLSTGCIASKEVTINPLPLPYILTGGGVYCEGYPGVSIGMTGSEAGISYQLSIGSSTAGAPVTGTDSIIDFGLHAAAGIYTVTATDPLTTCASNMPDSVTIIINPTPEAYSVTGGGSFCAGGTGSDIGLSGSDASVNYQLYDGTTATGSILSGTGSALDFGLQTSAGTYSVVATNPATTCFNNMPGAATITVITAVTPIVTVTAEPGLHISAGEPDTLFASVARGGTVPSYQWLINGISVTGATSSTFISSSFFDGDAVRCEVTNTDPCGLSGSNSVVITLSSAGIKQIESGNAGISVIPNPAHTELIVTATVKIADLTITNLLGQTVFKQEYDTEKASVNVANLPDGVYLIRINGSDVRRFVKQ